MRISLIFIMVIDKELKYPSIDTKYSILKKIELVLMAHDVVGPIDQFDLR